MKKFAIAVFHNGIGNEMLFIHADNEETAFEKLFNYYKDKSDRLGYWLDGDGKDAGDFNTTDGIFESEPEWNWFITDVSAVKVLGEDAKYERMFCGWNVSEVMSIYPTMTKDQAYDVLCYTEKEADYERGVSYDIIESNVSILFPELIRPDIEESSEN